MREYQKLQKMEVAKVEASGGSESASGTEESEAVEPDLYYYHTDHLGSTTFITDRNGDIAQYLAYIPYGETFIEERNVAPYKFNGKELDQETGYYYYGARYYDPGTALWLGVDPLAEKYPGVSPYVYCAGNPVKYVDPDGNEIKIGTWYGRILAKLGVDNFEAKVQKQLNNIKSMSPSLNKMVTKLETSKTTYSIEPVTKRSNYKEMVRKGSKNYNGYNRNSNTVYFDPDNRNGGDNMNRPAEAGLAHELGHAEDDDNGCSIEFDRNKVDNHDVIEMDKCQRNEINAISRENEVRDAMGYPERDYNYFTVKKEDN